MSRLALAGTEEEPGRLGASEGGEGARAESSAPGPALAHWPPAVLRVLSNWASSGTCVLAHNGLDEASIVSPLRGFLDPSCCALQVGVMALYLYKVTAHDTLSQIPHTHTLRSNAATTPTLFAFENLWNQKPFRMNFLLPSFLLFSFLRSLLALSHTHPSQSVTHAFAYTHSHTHTSLIQAPQ